MTSQELSGAVAVVTGATRGIGRATVELLAARGATVVVSARSAAECEAFAQDLSVSGAQAVGLPVDVSDADSIAGLYAEVASRFGRLDICVNNAGGVAPGDGALLDTGLQAWRRSLEINLTGTFLSLQHQLPPMIASGGGAIVNVSGTAALLGSATPQIGYDAAKAGLIALTRDVAVAHAGDGVRCNVVCPGPISGPLIDSLVTEEVRRDRMQHIPAGRFGSFTEVAHAIAHLASPHAGWTTGVVLPVDGGITAAYNTRQVTP